MMDIREDIAKVAVTLPQNVELLAVTKFHPIKALQEGKR